MYELLAVEATILLGLGAAMAGVGSVLSGIAALKTARKEKEVKSETPE